MLTDTALRSLKAQPKSYKITDRDGMYVIVTPAGTITFRLDYRLNGRRETLTIGKYGRDGISLAQARDRCIAARKSVREGLSPAMEKQREKRRLKAAKCFGEFAERWFSSGRMAQSTIAMRRHIYDRDIAPVWKNRLLHEVSPEDLRALCERVRDRGAPATAIHVRDIIKQIFVFAIQHGERIDNPAEAVAPASIATFETRDRSLSPGEIRLAFELLQRVATQPTFRLGLRFILLTLVRKSELIYATWDEIDFANAVWSIPKERMKRSRPHNVYLSAQAIDILVALKTCAAGSRYLLPSRHDLGEPLSHATFNRITAAIVALARAEDLPLSQFTVHDLRRTGSTLLNEVGFNRDWIEKCLAHEEGRSSRGVYNRAEYEAQRRHMLQEWANLIDAWCKGERYQPLMFPQGATLVALDPYS